MELIQEKKWPEKSHLSTHASLAPLGSLFTLILLGHKQRTKEEKNLFCNCAVHSSQYSVFEQNLPASQLDEIAFNLPSLYTHFRYSTQNTQFLKAFISMRTECAGLERKPGANKTECWNLKLKVEGGGGVTGKVVAHGTLIRCSFIWFLISHCYQNQAI